VRGKCPFARPRVSRDRGRREQLRHGHRARRPALPRHRQGGSERPARRPSHRRPYRHQERVARLGSPARPAQGHRRDCRGRG